MTQWRCRACGKVFQGDKPEEHGDLVITFGESVIKDICKGTLELLPDYITEN